MALNIWHTTSNMNLLKVKEEQGNQKDIQFFFVLQNKLLLRPNTEANERLENRSALRHNC